MNDTYYSNGKLLLTAEYGVLDGALALAIPTKYGQSLKIETTDTDGLIWESLDDKGECWLSVHFKTPELDIISCSNSALGDTLSNILKAAKKLNPNFIAAPVSIRATTELNFPREWGLGTSSTLINNIAQWAKVDPYALLKNTFGGSGYDIACAQHHTPILYRLKGGQPIVEPVSFNPTFKDQLYFVYLNQKQNSREAIANYRAQNFNMTALVDKLSELTHMISKSMCLEEFEVLLKEHEQLLSKVLGMKPIKEKRFHDYFGALKSLGGWGGDFILATGNKKTPDYFKDRGFDIVIPFGDMIL